MSPSKSMLLLPAVLFALSVPLLTAAQNEPPASKMTTFYMAILHRGAGWNSDKSDQTRRIGMMHTRYLDTLAASGKLAIAGQCTDDGQICEILVFSVDSFVEARTLAESDPAVKVGHFVTELHPWYAAKGVIRKPADPAGRATYYIGLLRRGAQWSPEPTPERDRLQREHLANINRLAESGRLVHAGPFSDDGVLRGVFVFKVGSLDEAKALSSGDPAVKAGRLVVDVHPWEVPEGSLP